MHDMLKMSIFIGKKRGRSKTTVTNYHDEDGLRTEVQGSYAFLKKVHRSHVAIRKWLNKHFSK